MKLAIYSNNGAQSKAVVALFKEKVAARTTDKIVCLGLSITMPINWLLCALLACILVTWAFMRTGNILKLTN